MNNKLIIKHHPRELHDLQEFFCLLTKQCNSNCAFCIEREVHTGGFINKIILSLVSILLKNTS